ncbi:hypothetical protein VOLCADRAFT_99479 [Volvox carteri f. nagariensis]|uniref:Uncharacterized protein n=1 Tax=Volvox carteri f. nagariensis TaxID=3068 RepID=D8UHW7_VOLCA|nr:uncharacterized protein VOLCADRAFT_99479 [Volvox carteri f. nagariensis]EFJ40710.1 hypothetical protein VOLCADRAFT_99479 [Volvox carteri f. nagariensis]|eukprot:XP_002958256.1 hypothetical protein VOLCADRAFT_99479 [Volvox carteri f. nagariensis]
MEGKGRSVDLVQAAVRFDNNNNKGGGMAVQRPGQYAAPDGPTDGDEEYWEWLFKEEDTPESPYGSDILRALLSAISPKFAVKRPEDYIPVTPSSISSGRYVRSDIWTCGPSEPDTPVAGAAATARGGDTAAQGPASPNVLQVLAAAAAAANSGLFPGELPVAPSPRHPRQLHRREGEEEQGCRETVRGHQGLPRDSDLDQAQGHVDGSVQPLQGGSSPDRRGGQRKVLNRRAAAAVASIVGSGEAALGRQPPSASRQPGVPSPHPHPQRQQGLLSPGSQRPRDAAPAVEAPRWLQPGAIELAATVPPEGGVEAALAALTTSPSQQPREQQQQGPGRSKLCQKRGSEAEAERAALAVAEPLWKRLPPEAWREAAATAAAIAAAEASLARDICARCSTGGAGGEGDVPVCSECGGVLVDTARGLWCPQRQCTEGGWQPPEEAPGAGGRCVEQPVAPPAGRSRFYQFPPPQPHHHQTHQQPGCAHTGVTGGDSASGQVATHHLASEQREPYDDCPAGQQDERPCVRQSSSRPLSSLSASSTSSLVASGAAALSVVRHAAATSSLAPATPSGPVNSSSSSCVVVVTGGQPGGFRRIPSVAWQQQQDEEEGEEEQHTAATEQLAGGLAVGLTPPRPSPPSPPSPPHQQHQHQQLFQQAPLQGLAAERCAALLMRPSPNALASAAAHASGCGSGAPGSAPEQGAGGAMRRDGLHPGVARCSSAVALLPGGPGAAFRTPSPLHPPATAGGSSSSSCSNRFLTPDRFLLAGPCHAAVAVAAAGGYDGGGKGIFRTPSPTTGGCGALRGGSGSGGYGGYGVRYGSGSPGGFRGPAHCIRARSAGPERPSPLLLPPRLQPRTPGSPLEPPDMPPSRRTPPPVVPLTWEPPPAPSSALLPPLLHHQPQPSPLRLPPAPAQHRRSHSGSSSPSSSGSLYGDNNDASSGGGAASCELSPSAIEALLSLSPRRRSGGSVGSPQSRNVAPVGAVGAGGAAAEVSGVSSLVPWTRKSREQPQRTRQSQIELRGQGPGVAAAVAAVTGGGGGGGPPGVQSISRATPAAGDAQQEHPQQHQLVLRPPVAASRQAERVGRFSSILDVPSSQPPAPQQGPPQRLQGAGPGGQQPPPSGRHSAAAPRTGPLAGPHRARAVAPERYAAAQRSPSAQQRNKGTHHHLLKGHRKSPPWKRSKALLSPGALRPQSGDVATSSAAGTGGAVSSAVTSEPPLLYRPASMWRMWQGSSSRKAPDAIAAAGGPAGYCEGYDDSGEVHMKAREGLCGGGGTGAPPGQPMNAAAAVGTDTSWTTTITLAPIRAPNAACDSATSPFRTPRLIAEPALGPAGAAAAHAGSEKGGGSSSGGGSHCDDMSISHAAPSSMSTGTTASAAAARPVVSSADSWRTARSVSFTASSSVTVAPGPAPGGPRSRSSSNLMSSGASSGSSGSSGQAVSTRVGGPLMPSMRVSREEYGRVLCSEASDSRIPRATATAAAAPPNGFRTPPPPPPQQQQQQQQQGSSCVTAAPDTPAPTHLGRAVRILNEAACGGADEDGGVRRNLFPSLGRAVGSPAAVVIPTTGPTDAADPAPPLGGVAVVVSNDVRPRDSPTGGGSAAGSRLSRFSPPTTSPRASAGSNSGSSSSGSNSNPGFLPLGRVAPAPLHCPEVTDPPHTRDRFGLLSPPATSSSAAAAEGGQQAHLLPPRPRRRQWEVYSTSSHILTHNGVGEGPEAVAAAQGGHPPETSLVCTAAAAAAAGPPAQRSSTDEGSNQSSFASAVPFAPKPPLAPQMPRRSSSGAGTASTAAAAAATTAGSTAAAMDAHTAAFAAAAPLTSATGPAPQPPVVGGADVQHPAVQCSIEFPGRRSSAGWGGGASRPASATSLCSETSVCSNSSGGGGGGSNSGQCHPHHHHWNYRRSRERALIINGAIAAATAAAAAAPGGPAAQPATGTGTGTGPQQISLQARGIASSG